jgi:hypothetical protein
MDDAVRRRMPLDVGGAEGALHDAQAGDQNARSGHGGHQRPLHSAEDILLGTNTGGDV